MKKDNKNKVLSLLLLSIFIFLLSITFVLALSPPKLTLNSISCSEIRFNNGILGASAICDGLDASGVGEETDPFWTGNISNYYTKSNIIGFGYYNTSEQIFVIVDNGTFLKSYTETDPKAYNGTLAYNQTLTDMWGAFLDKTNNSYRTLINGSFVTNVSALNSILGDNICYSNGTNCPAGGSGDITAIYNLSKYFWVNSSESGDVYLNFSELILNQTIDNREMTNTSLQVFLAVDNGTFVKRNQNWNDTNFLVPALNNTYDLGNSTNIFRNIWVGTLNLITKITTSQLADAIITAIKLATNSVNTTHIVDYTILGTDIGNGQINASKITAGAINITHTASDFNATYLTNSTMNKTTSCSNIIGSPDSDFCTDATGGGATNTSYRTDYNYTWVGNLNATGNLVSGILTSASCDVKSYTNGTLYCGTDATGSGSYTTWKNVSTNTTRKESYISATTLRVIPELSTILSVNRNYSYECYISFMTNVTTTGIALASTFSATPLAVSYTAEIPVVADGVGGAFQGWGTSNNDTIVGTGVQAINTNYTAKMYGVVNVNSASITFYPSFRTEIVNTGAFVWGRSMSYCKWEDINGVG